MTEINDHDSAEAAAARNARLRDVNAHASAFLSACERMFASRDEYGNYRQVDARHLQVVMAHYGTEESRRRCGVMLYQDRRFDPALWQCSLEASTVHLYWGRSGAQRVFDESANTVGSGGVRYVLLQELLVIFAGMSSTVNLTGPERWTMMVPQRLDEIMLTETYHEVISLFVHLTGLPPAKLMALWATHRRYILTKPVAGRGFNPTPAQHAEFRHNVTIYDLIHCKNRPEDYEMSDTFPAIHRIASGKAGLLRSRDSMEYASREDADNRNLYGREYIRARQMQKTRGPNYVANKKRGRRNRNRTDR